MAFSRDLNDPVQRRKQQFDDILSGKAKSMKLEPLEHFDEEVKAEKAEKAEKATQKTGTIKKKTVVKAKK